VTISGFCLSQNLNTGGLNIPQEQFWVRKSPEHQDDIAGNMNFAIMYVNRITRIMSVRMIVVIIDFVCRVLIMYDFFSGFILMTYFRKNFYFCMLRDFISFAFYIMYVCIFYTTAAVIC